MTRRVFLATSHEAVLDGFMVDLRGDLIRWTLHTTDDHRLAQAIDTAAGGRPASARTDSETDGERFTRLVLQGGASIGITSRPGELAEWVAHPTELARNDRRGWREFLAMCARSAEGSLTPGTLTSMDGEWIFAVYIPSLRTWLVRDEFSLEDEFDSPTFYDTSSRSRLEKE